MGPGLADGLQQSSATSADWRTTPLWGVRFRKRFLHDGRAGTLEEAILAHGGEAARSRERFQQLSRLERASILAFLKTL